MRRRIAAAALAALTLVAVSVPASAQDPLRISLDDALRLAEGSNPTYRRATNDVLLNGTEMRTAWLERVLPSARLTLFTGFTGNRQGTSQDLFGNPISSDEVEWTYFSNTTQQLSLDWTVQGISLFQEHRRQTLVNEGRELAREVALTALQVEVRLLYMDALEQLELMQSEAELLEARRIDLDVAERLFSLALRTRVDVLNAELAVEQQALVLQQQDAAYRTALLELATALGTDDDRPLEVVDDGLPIFDPRGIEVDALVSTALEVNPTLQQSDLAIATADQGLSSQRNAWWPSLSFGFDVYRRAQSTAGSALFDPALDRDLESRFSLSLSVPVLNNFFSTRTEQQRATIVLRNEREADRAARLEVEKTVRGAVLSLDNQWESLRLAERSREIAEETVRLAREQYRLGSSTFEELRAAFDNEAQTRRQVITSRHAFVEALLRLEEAVGGPVRPAGALISSPAGAR